MLYTTVPEICGICRIRVSFVSPVSRVRYTPDVRMSAESERIGSMSNTDARAMQGLPDVSELVVGVLGGTGEQGRGLAVRLAMSGLRVVIGSRDARRAQEIAAEVGHGIRGASNEECARISDLVIVAVPWDGHALILSDLRGALAGKIVVDCVNPMGFDAGGAYSLPVPEGSAAQQAASLQPDSRVVGAFHHVSAVMLLDTSQAMIETDIMVVGDDREATDTAQALAFRIPGMRGIYAGKLRNAGQVEALTANLISVNRRYKSHAGVRMTDV